MVEKSGKHFELCSKLYDHAARNGSNYLNGHCMVSPLLSFPVYRDGKILYLSVPVDYRLWDKEKASSLAYALVTAPKNGKGSRRLFLCTAGPRTISFDWENSADKTTCCYGAETVFYLPLAWYGLRWNIEVSYYEGKTFWSMEEYRVRSKERIERLVNLISLSYSAITLLSYSDETLSGYQSASA